MLFRKTYERYRTVDPGSGVPPGVGLILVVRYDAEGVMPGLYRYGEGKIAVGMGSFALSVHEYLGAMVHAFKGQIGMIAWDIQLPYILIILRGEPADVGAAGRGGGAGLGEHGIVGKGDILPVVVPQMGIAPGGIQGKLLHGQRLRCVILGACGPMCEGKMKGMLRERI